MSSVPQQPRNGKLRGGWKLARSNGRFILSREFGSIKDAFAVYGDIIFGEPDHAAVAELAALVQDDAKDTAPLLLLGPGKGYYRPVYPEDIQ